MFSCILIQQKMRVCVCVSRPNSRLVSIQSVNSKRRLVFHAATLPLLIPRLRLRVDVDHPCIADIRSVRWAFSLFLAMRSPYGAFVVLWETEARQIFSGAYFCRLYDPSLYASERQSDVLGAPISRAFQPSPMFVLAN